MRHKPLLDYDGGTGQLSAASFFSNHSDHGLVDESATRL
jgi:hypothetical protein